MAATTACGTKNATINDSVKRAGGIDPMWLSGLKPREKCRNRQSAGIAESAFRRWYTMDSCTRESPVAATISAQLLGNLGYEIERVPDADGSQPLQVVLHEGLKLGLRNPVYDLVGGEGRPEQQLYEIGFGEVLSVVDRDLAQSHFVKRVDPFDHGQRQLTATCRAVVGKDARFLLQVLKRVIRQHAGEECHDRQRVRRAGSSLEEPGKKDESHDLDAGLAAAAAANGSAAGPRARSKPKPKSSRRTKIQREVT